MLFVSYEEILGALSLFLSDLSVVIDITIIITGINKIVNWRSCRKVSVLIVIQLIFILVIELSFWILWSEICLKVGFGRLKGLDLVNKFD